MNAMDLFMKITKNKKYYYHITSFDWGFRKKLFPRHFPKKELEPPFKRICVSSIISGCMLAISCVCLGHTTYVYRTEHKVNVIYPWRVYDAWLTKERWLIKPTWFVQCAVISENILSKIKKLKQNSQSLKTDILIIQRVLLENNIKEIVA